MRSCKPWARSKVKQGHGWPPPPLPLTGGSFRLPLTTHETRCMRPCGPAPTCCAHSSAESKRIAIDIRHVSAHVPLMVPAHKQQGGGGVAAALKRLLPSPAALGRRIASQASLLKVGSSSGKKPGSHRQVGRLASGWAMPAASSAQHLLTRTRYASCATCMWFCVHLSMLHCASHLPSACLLQVLFDISGSVQPGEVLALMGEPAAGQLEAAAAAAVGCPCRRWFLQAGCL